MAYYGGGGGGRRDDDERITETYTSTDYDRGYGGGYGGPGPREDERFTETRTTFSESGSAPPPPQVPYPWRAQWDDRERCYFYIHQETGERTYEVPNRQPYGGGGYGERSYEQSTTYVDEDRGVRQQGGGGHGLMYGALGAAAGVAGGALLMHEGHEVKQDWDRDEQRVEDFPEDAAQWTGRKVGEVEDVPEDIEQGFDRFGNRIGQGFNNAVDDVEDAPENVAGWVGNKVGDVERFGDNVDNSYDEGKYEGRNDDRW